MPAPYDLLEPTRDDLPSLLTALPRDEDAGHGDDIDEAHQVLLSDAGEPEKRDALAAWIARWQPCVFGRIAVRENAHPGMDFCIVTEDDLAAGAEHVRDKVQAARRAWKDRAAAGLSSSLQVLFNSADLAHARPGPEFVAACQVLVGLYMPERQPIQTDTIYLDSVPLRRPDGRLEMFAANVTSFFPGAHHTAVHDHRCPGGLLLNVNAIGHYTYAQVYAGRYATVEEGMERSHKTALRSVGNGGIGHRDGRGSTWHQRPGDTSGHGRSRGRPGFVPPDADPDRYLSLYHIDVAIPSLFADPAEPEGDDAAWTIMMDYFVPADRMPAHHPPGLMHGCPVSDDQKYASMWPAESRSPDEKLF